MSIKTSIRKTPEVGKACDLIVNVKSVIYIDRLYIYLEWSQLWQNTPMTTCPCTRRGEVHKGLRLSSEHKILPVYRASKKNRVVYGEDEGFCNSQLRLRKLLMLLGQFTFFLTGFSLK